MPTNGQTKNKLFELTTLPYAARNTAWLSLKADVRMHGFINAFRMRIVSALAKGGAHTIAGAQCMIFVEHAATTGDMKLLTQAVGGVVFNVYCIAVQADIGSRCVALLERKRKRVSSNGNSNSC